MTSRNNLVHPSSVNCLHRVYHFCSECMITSIVCWFHLELRRQGIVTRMGTGFNSDRLGNENKIWNERGNGNGNDLMVVGENGSINCIPAHVYLSHTPCAKNSRLLRRSAISLIIFGARRKLKYVNNMYLFHNQGALCFCPSVVMHRNYSVWLHKQRHL